MSNYSWYPNSDDATSILAFVMYFSRLEYALKCVPGYSISGRTLKPDWAALTQHPSFRALSPELTPALSYLSDHPPCKQVSPSQWEPIVVERNWSSAIAALKVVRNNLFHGGKHSPYSAVNPIRDRVLIRHCFTIMEYVVARAPAEIRLAFEGHND